MFSFVLVIGCEICRVDYGWMMVLGLLLLFSLVFSGEESWSLLGGRRRAVLAKLCTLGDAPMRIVNLSSKKHRCAEQQVRPFSPESDT